MDNSPHLIRRVPAARENEEIKGEQGRRGERVCRNLNIAVSRDNTGGPFDLALSVVALGWNEPAGEMLHYNIFRGTAD